MKQSVLLWADASATIGFGHFIRTLALAEMLKDEFGCTFFTQSPNLYQKQEVSKVCKLVELPSDDSRFEKFLTYLNGKEIVVLDNYFFSSEFEKTIKTKGSKLVCIGTNNHHYNADVVVNFTNLTSKDFRAEPYTKFCLGLQWTILRSPFYNYIPTKKEGIVICLGGTDQFLYSEMLYDIIRLRYKTIPIRIIATDRIGKHRIENILRKGIDLMLNLNAEQMVYQFATSEIAVVSASSVALEALSQYTQVVAGTYVDNQINLYKSLKAGNYIWEIGDFGEASDKMLNAIAAIKKGERRKKWEATNTITLYKRLFDELCF